jgi:hypothetical protein
LFGKSGNDAGADNSTGDADADQGVVIAE